MFSPATSSPSRVADRSSVTSRRWPPGARRRPAGRGGGAATARPRRPRRRRLGRRQLDAQAAVAGHGDLGRTSHVASKPTGPSSSPPVISTSGDGDQVDVVLAHGLGQVLRDGVAQCLLAGRREADAGLEHPARRLAGAEPGQPDLPGDLAERLVDVAVELGLVDVDRELDLVPLEGLHRALHRTPRVAAAQARRARRASGDVTGLAMAARPWRGAARCAAPRGLGGRPRRDPAAGSLPRPRPDAARELTLRVPVRVGR